MITLPIWVAFPAAVILLLAWFGFVDRVVNRIVKWWITPLRDDAAFIPPGITPLQEAVRRRQLLSLVESSATRRTGTK